MGLGYLSFEYLPKLSLTAFSTLVIWKPDAHMVMVGNATSVTGRAVFFKVVTTWMLLINIIIIIFIVTGRAVFFNVVTT